MGNITLRETAIISEFTDIVEDFLPCTANRGNDRDLCFYAAAMGMRLRKFWLPGLSKRAAITHLIANVYAKRPEKFFPLLKEILHRGIKYRKNRRNAIKNEEIEALIIQIDKLGRNDQELSDLRNYFSPTRNRLIIKKPVSRSISELKKEYSRIKSYKPQKRGYAFQGFFYKLLFINQHDPKSSFRNDGEEIDGSFQLEGNTFVLEIKWHSSLTSHKDVFAFEGKIERKFKNTIGLFFSHSGFTKECLTVVERGKSTCMIGMDGKDLQLILDEKINLTEAIKLKLRKASESNVFFIPLNRLMNQG